ncbi:TPA: transcriptional regulator [Pseudomonas aeruginosa]|uniref:transcriptional regulator n=1 Tax=Pseudomonas aeruginosa TaxID=287 RepID=UPI001369CFBB|nr:transcriptional regulator [Pseudomonas aeruginosa]MXU52375.1 transcriptional regulator [Pseudomonas aeruginosa]HBN9846899.1 transcriptional regulator [Pseudomonas aeruginosa]HBN9848095.1 transcriptional regulator [Pseudomonas aeruginosa]
MQTEPEIKELSDFLDEFNKESDRGAVLNAAALLDEWLLNILKGFLADTNSSKDLLSGFNAPLGSFSARAAAAHALGLIQDNEFQEITIIRKIRNEFGHNWRGVSFETRKISDLANNLPWLGPKDVEAGSGPRARFNFAVAILLSDLLWRARLVKKSKIEPNTWTNKSRS